MSFEKWIARLNKKNGQGTPPLSGSANPLEEREERKTLQENKKEDREKAEEKKKKQEGARCFK